MQYSYIEEFDAAMRVVATLAIAQEHTLTYFAEMQAREEMEAAAALAIEQTYNDQSLEELGVNADDAPAALTVAAQTPVIGIPARQPARIPFCVCRDKWHTTATGT